MYVNVAMVLDCSDLGLDYIPGGYKNVRVLDMRRNNISSVSEGNLLGLYPNLDLIDLRENPINCRKAIFSKIKVKVNCAVSTNTVQTELLLSSQQFYYTTSTAMQMDLRASKKCLRCVSTSTLPRLTLSSSSTNKVAWLLSAKRTGKINKYYCTRYIYSDFDFYVKCMRVQISLGEMFGPKGRPAIC